MDSTIEQLMASSPNSLTLTYSLTGSADFAIDGSSGIITTTRTLDYVSMSSYTLSIEASDGTNTGRATVTINLIQIASIGNSLVCTTVSIQGELLEGELGLNVPLPNCFNGDGSVASHTDLTYTISSGDPNSLFEVTSTPSISNTVQLDYESQEIHNLILDVTNSEMPPRGAALTAIVRVLPVNEFPPIFSSDLIQISILEIVGIGTTVGRIVATDQDSGSDGIISYSQVQPTTNVIFVHSDTGDVILTNLLDYESIQMYRFTVTATDNTADDASRMSATAVLVINIQDANDNPPTFTRAIYSAVVRETSPVGHNVGTLLCSDQDTGINSAVAYSILDGNDGNKFSIDVATGAVTLAERVSYDMPDNSRLFTLRVQCQEVQPPRAMAESLLIIQITSNNDYRPDPGNRYTARVREDARPGTVITQIRGRDRDFGPAGTLRYFLNQNNLPSCPDNLFIDISNGMIYLMSALDYEMGSRIYECTVAVYDSEPPIHIAEQEVSITVVNVNDAEPVCTPQVHRIEIFENVPVGRNFLTLSCRDPDSTSLHYSFTDQTITKFNLNQRGEVSVREQLDFETQSLHIIQVTVSDGEYSTNTSIYLTVVGFNEYTPIFSPLPDCTILENALLGSTVCTLQASDADAGSDGVVDFEIITASGEFDIDHESGLVYLIGGIDRETVSQYILTVRASDQGTPVMNTEVMLTIRILDVNDNSPRMDAHIFISVPENAPMGSSVATLTCTDPDQMNSPNSNTQLQIMNVLQELEDGSLSVLRTPLFSVNPTSGELTVNGPLNYEMIQRYHVSTVCRDQGVPSLATSSTVHIQVAPMNEFTPSFTQARYEATIPENSALGSSILSVTATDDDTGLHGEIRYSIDMPGAVPFWINPQTGVINIVGQLQCHLATRYSFQALASDGGAPPRQSSVELIIMINQCHLEELVPASDVYVGDVTENSPVGTSVLTVSCTSSRTVSVVNPNYMLIERSDVFQVDALSGEITVQHPPDYEQSTSHLLHVRCFDPNHSQMVHADLSVHVSILPINEHSPIFRQTSYIFNVSESVSLGSRIGVIQALDSDRGRDGDVVYTIQDPNMALIDHITGEIFLMRELDREHLETLTLIATAQDNPVDRSLVRSSGVQIVIRVQDDNDNWPVCNRTVFHIHLPPQTRPPAVVFSNAECTDRDIGSNSLLHYSLGELNNLFSLDSNTGELQLTSLLNPEDAEAYRVPIIVSDSGSPSLSITLLVIVDFRASPLQIPGDFDQTPSKYLSLVEAEGLKNSVKIQLKDVSRSIVSIFN